MRGFAPNKSIRKNVPLKNYTTYRIGGQSKQLVEVFDRDALVKFAAAFWGDELLVLGRGSNVLVSDMGFNGTTIINRSNEVRFSGQRFYVDSGVLLSQLAIRTVELGLKGLEFACSIPGSVGGACIMNAGAFGGSISDVLYSVDILRDGKEMTLLKDECGLSYRNSAFRAKDVILGAEFVLTKGDKAELLELKNQYALVRKKTQPKGYSCGSVFKKADKAAGYYIDKAGLKGFGFGGAQVSRVHANFIINKGNARASEVASLIDLIKANVKVKFDVELVEEVKYIGFDLRSN